MSNRFCVILNEGNKLLTLTTQPQDKVYLLRQGYLLIGDNTPYKAFEIDKESWHIIGHIDNLPLLNYLLFSYYPSHNDFISKEIICFAIKRYGMKIIELLQGNFCIICEDAKGNLTLVTEDETRRDNVNAEDAASPDRTGNPPRSPAAAAGAMLQYPFLSYSPAGKKMSRALSPCRCPQADYQHQREITIIHWHDNHLQYIQSVRYPLYSGEQAFITDDIKKKVVDINKYSLLSNL